MSAKNQDEYIFSMSIDVRDYEVDIEGIVNNANYLHYLEHTRHAFCKEAGLSFGEMHSRGIDPVLRHVEIDYLTPLTCGDVMTSCLNLRRKGARFIFVQDIYRKSDNAPVVRALVTVACLENGRLSRGEALAEAFSRYLK